MTIVLFGASNQGRSLISFQNLSPDAGYVLVDNDANKWGTDVAGLIVRRPEAGLITQAEYVLITSMWVGEIVEQIAAMGVTPSRIGVPSKLLIRPNTGPDFSDPAVQSLGISMLEAVFANAASDATSIWLDFGTLLGFHRDNAFIQGDGDVDLSVVEKKKGDFLKISSAVKQWANGRVPYTYKRHADSDSVVRAIGPTLLPVNTSRCIVQNDLIAYPQNDHLSSVPTHLVLPLVPHPRFSNLLMPNRTDDYLKMRYGTSWRTPDPDWGYVYGLEQLGLRIVTSLSELKGDVDQRSQDCIERQFPPN